MLTDHAKTKTQNKVRIEGQDHLKLNPILVSRQILITMATLESSYSEKQIPLNPCILGIVPLLEVPIQDSAGEPLPADPDSFQHTVTSELVDDQMMLHDAWTTAWRQDFLRSKPLDHSLFHAMYSGWTNLGSWFHLGSDTWQNVDECSSDLSLTCPGSPIREKVTLFQKSLCFRCRVWMIKGPYLDYPEESGHCLEGGTLLLCCFLSSSTRSIYTRRK